MSYDKRLDVTLSLRITDKNQPFNSADIEWNDVPYAGVLEIQKNLIAFLAAMNALGYATDTQGGLLPPVVEPDKLRGK